MIRQVVAIPHSADFRTRRFRLHTHMHTICTHVVSYTNLITPPHGVSSTNLVSIHSSVYTRQIVRKLYTKMRKTDRE